MSTKQPAHHKLLIEHLEAIKRDPTIHLAISPLAGPYEKQRLSGKRLREILQAKRL